MGESEYKAGIRDGRYRLYYFDQGGALKQEGVFKADKREGVFTDYYVSGEVSARSPYVGGLRNGEDVDSGNTLSDNQNEALSWSNFTSSKSKIYG